jgi:hypothetical protein
MQAGLLEDPQMEDGRLQSSLSGNRACIELWLSSV